MAAITEDYVSFETAKLLKEKGFPLPSTNFEDWVFCMYDENGDIQWGCYHPDYYCRVTLQMAMKWLREEYNLFIQVTIVPHTTITMEQKYYFFLIHKDRRRIRWDDIPIVYYNSYEEACEAAIKYCLENLI